jgi:hypothetical protein
MLLKRIVGVVGQEWRGQCYEKQVIFSTAINSQTTLNDYNDKVNLSVQETKYSRTEKGK